MKFVVYRDRGKQWRWSLRARNGNIIADCGEGYKRKRSCLKGIAAVKKAVNAPVIGAEAAKEKA